MCFFNVPVISLLAKRGADTVITSSIYGFAKIVVERKTTWEFKKLSSWWKNKASWYKESHSVKFESQSLTKGILIIFTDGQQYPKV